MTSLQLTPRNGAVVQLPWPCSGCGEGHERKRTYWFTADWYECECGVRTPRATVLELLAGGGFQ